MDMSTFALAISAAAAVSGIVGALIGHNIREKRHATTLEDVRSYWQQSAAIHDEHRQRNFQDAQAYKLALEQETEKLTEAKAFIESLREQIRLLEQGMDHCHSEIARIQAELQPYADAMWLAAGEMKLPSHGSAMEQLERMFSQCQYTQDVAMHKLREELTDLNGEFAKKVARKAKREHGKKLRAKHERLMQVLRDKASGFEELHRMAEEELLDVQKQLLIRSSAFRATCKDKLKLKGVRDSFKQAFWEEVSRLNKQNKETK